MNVRPTGVTVLAVAFIILGVYYFIWSLFLFGVGLFGAAEPIFYAPLAGNKAMAGVLGMVTTAVMIATGVGLLGMKTWSWYLAFIGMILMLFQIVTGLSDSLVAWSLFQLALVALFTYVLLQKETRVAFGVSSDTG